METIHIDHVAYAKKVRNMTHAELQYTIKDAGEAMRANPKGQKAGYYADEVNYCTSEIHRRKGK